MKLRPVMFLALWALAAACDPVTSEPAPSITRTVEGRSQQVLYAPARYAVSPTYQVSVAGFRLADRPREALAAVVDTTTDRLQLVSASPADFTSPVFAQNALLQLVSQTKASITALLPLADPDEGTADWSISALQTGLTHDVYGNLVVYGRYRFAYKPIYQLRSIDLYRYLAAALLRKDWSDFPADESKYYPSGSNALHFSIALSLHDDSGYFTGGNDAKRVGVSFAVTPENKRVEDSWADLDDLMAFKTLGHQRDTLYEDTLTFNVGEAGPAADFVVAIDRNGSLVDEAITVRSMLVEFINRLATESGYDYRVAFLTQGSTDYVRLTDGTRFVSAKSADPEALVQAALDEVLATADGATSVAADLLRTAALAVTAPAANGVNKPFRRPQAPLALLYISDRDDRSDAPDGSYLASDEAYIAAYKQALRPYNRWFLVAPSRGGCQGADLDSAETAARLVATVSALAGDYFDLCRLSIDKLLTAVLDWGDQTSSPYPFPHPPLPFTLAVSVSDRALVRDSDGGFSYDVLGDRLAFMPSAEPQPGDVVHARFYRIKPRNEK